MMHIESDYHYRNTQRLMGKFQDDIAYMLDCPPAGWDAERVESQCRDMQFQVERFRFQMRAYEDVQEGRTEQIHNPTGEELRALEFRMWDAACRTVARLKSERAEANPATKRNAVDREAGQAVLASAH